MPALPARVRITRPPLPLAPTVQGTVARLCPAAPVGEVTAATLAIAGSAVIGAALRWTGGEALGVDTGWRGRGIEGALTGALGET